MAAVFNFKIDRQTRSAIAAQAGSIRKPAPERIQDELFKILQCAESHSYLAMMARNDLLFSIFTEFTEPGQQHLQPEGFRTLSDQALEAYGHLEKILNSKNDIRSSFGNQPFPGNDPDRFVLIKWAVLFHDLGRLNSDPATGDGQFEKPTSFAEKNALLARRICERLRFSRRHSDSIELIIRQHAKPVALFGNRPKTSVVEKGLIRLFLECHDHTPDVLLHALAAFRGQKDADDLSSKEFTAFIQMLIKKYASELCPRASLPPPISGNDLIDEFGMTPSPGFKDILRRIEEERLSKPNFSRDKALKLVSELLGRKQ
jgi:tRNA nucleotidyltransferase/poly(A) polymerase